MSDERALSERLRGALAAVGAEAAPTPSCPDTARIWAAVTGELPARTARELVDHAATCPACAFAWRLAHEVAVEAGTESAAAAAPASIFTGFRWRSAWLAAGLALAALLGTFLALQLGGQGRRDAAAHWRHVAVIPAPSVATGGALVWRGEPAADAELAAALVPYSQGDWPAAERALSSLMLTHPADGRGAFYLGVTLLLLDRPGDAAARLEEAGRLRGVAADLIDWYLALALLKSGRAADAIAPLDRLAAAPVHHRAEAMALRERVRAVLERRP